MATVVITPVPAPVRNPAQARGPAPARGPAQQQQQQG